MKCCAAWNKMTVFITDLFLVCSTTLWVGQLDKRTTQQDVASLLEEFGPIESINVSTTPLRVLIKMCPVVETLAVLGGMCIGL